MRVRLSPLCILACVFVFLVVDRITKIGAVASTNYSASPHFLSFAVPLNLLIGIAMLLISIFILLALISWKTWAEMGTATISVLILGSVLSNMYDLIRYNGIIDWIDLWIVKTNFADSGIVGGICMLLWNRRKWRTGVLK